MVSSLYIGFDTALYPEPSNWNWKQPVIILLFLSALPFPFHLTMVTSEDDCYLHGDHHTGFNQQPLQMKSIPDAIDESARVLLNKELRSYGPIDTFIF